MAELVPRRRVGSFPNRLAAELARAWLAEHDVDAAVTADDAGGSSPEIGFVAGGATLLVAADQVERATDLLRELPAGAGPVHRHSSGTRAVAVTVVAVVTFLAVALLVASLLWR